MMSCTLRCRTLFHTPKIWIGPWERQAMVQILDGDEQMLHLMLHLVLYSQAQERWVGVLSCY